MQHKYHLAVFGWDSLDLPGRPEQNLVGPLWPLCLDLSLVLSLGPRSVRPFGGPRVGTRLFASHHGLAGNLQFLGQIWVIVQGPR